MHQVSRLLHSRGYPFLSRRQGTRARIMHRGRVRRYIVFLSGSQQRPGCYSACGSVMAAVDAALVNIFGRKFYCSFNWPSAACRGLPLLLLLRDRWQAKMWVAVAGRGGLGGSRDEEYSVERCHGRACGDIRARSAPQRGIRCDACASSLATAQSQRLCHCRQPSWASRR